MEIVGPPDRRTAVRALASGANVRVAVFEDGTTPAPPGPTSSAASSPCSTPPAAPTDYDVHIVHITKGM